MNQILRICVNTLLYGVMLTCLYFMAKTAYGFITAPAWQINVLGWVFVIFTLVILYRFMLRRYISPIGK